MLYTYTLPIVFGFFILAVILRAAIPKEKVLYSLPALLVMAVFYFGTIYAVTPKMERPRVSIPRLPQADIYIDIVDTRTAEDKASDMSEYVQVIIHNGNCHDRLQIKRETLTDKDRLNKAIDKIITLRESTGGC